jgi:hypothetical protein
MSFDHLNSYYMENLRVKFEHSNKKGLEALDIYTLEKIQGLINCKKDKLAFSHLCRKTFYLDYFCNIGFWYRTPLPLWGSCCKKCCIPSYFTSVQETLIDTNIISPSGNIVNDDDMIVPTFRRIGISLDYLNDYTRETSCEFSHKTPFQLKCGAQYFLETRVFKIIDNLVVPIFSANVIDLPFCHFAMCELKVNGITLLPKDWYIEQGEPFDSSGPDSKKIIAHEMGSGGFKVFEYINGQCANMYYFPDKAPATISCLGIIRHLPEITNQLKYIKKRPRKHNWSRPLPLKQ